MVKVGNQKHIRKYLEKYAEPEALCDTSPINRSFDLALVLPCFDEPYEKVKAIVNASPSIAVLTVVVINAPDSASPAALDSTQRLLQDFLTSQCYNVNVPLGDCVYYLTNTQNLSSIVLVDRCSSNLIPSDEGVGLARKIGTDIALSLLLSGKIKSHWVGSTDADATLSDSYFEQLHKRQYSSKHAGAVFPFQHIATEPAIALPAKLYDCSLRYYVNALAWAGSPYAYHTIGSCLAFDLNAYAQVRGFPKRAGGEDFYLLNKLCKLNLQTDEGHAVVGGITCLNDGQLLLEARASHRVPFGTGPAIKSIGSTASPRDDYCYYHPRIFMLLRLWLIAISEFSCLVIDESVNDSMDCWQALIDQLGEQEDLSDIEMSLLNGFSFQSGWVKALDHVRKQCRHQQQVLQHLHTWFDGFKTLKFVHYMREHHYASVNLSNLVLLSGNIPDQFSQQVLPEELHER